MDCGKSSMSRAFADQPTPRSVQLDHDPIHSVRISRAADEAGACGEPADSAVGERFGCGGRQVFRLQAGVSKYVPSFARTRRRGRAERVCFTEGAGFGMDFSITMG